VVRSVAVITGHVEPGNRPLPDPAAVAAMDTVVILMGRSTLRSIADDLVAAGRSADTPAACIENGTTPSQRVVTATLGSIADAADRAGLEAPVVTVVGEVAKWAAEETRGAERGARSTGLVDERVRVV
jgi:siroheme synthase